MLEEVKIKTETLNSFCEKLDVKFLKIDVDGFEDDVLVGADKILAKQHPVVFMEFDTNIAKRTNKDPRALLEHFENAGYSSVKIWDNFSRYITETSDFNEVVRIANEVPHYINILLK